MGTRISYIVEWLRNSYWFVPAVMLVGAVLLAWVTTSLDEVSEPEEMPYLGEVIFSGGTDGAHEVLSTIASSMITVAGVVFSITIVTLQLASSQFGPRMLANFMRDRGNQLTLGTFIASFLYSLLVLRTIRSDDPDSVPHLSVTVALMLAVAGLVVLIYFIHHIATTIQAPNLIDALARELRRATDHLFPDVDEVDDARSPEAHPGLPEDFEERSRRVDARGSGYVQVIDVDRLVRIAHEHDLVMRVETRPGRFLVENSRFVSAYPSQRVGEDVAVAVAGTVVTGARRTDRHDIEFPIKQIVEIAVRALSTGVNDPFTASTCVDQLGAGLAELAGRALPSPYVVDEEDALRVVVGDPVTWERLVGGAYDQIRQCAESHTPVYVHLLEALTRVVGCVRDGSRLDPLVREAELVVEAAALHIESEADRAVVEQRYEALLAAVDRTRPRLARIGT
jgi:uncharacterized membrane protein